ncbi:sugar nucleotide-binding protein [Xanthobacter aminoxidans]|uniref:sugar nucleotide-binding protein n=1 Tax=Xanthobacter aminoxidans TaxID=186280 RepID=UPI0037276945
MIGATGFVGGQFAGQHAFVALLNSRNITQSRSVAFDTVVCATAPGSMFEANRFPEVDRERIEKVKENIAAITAKTFVLISTIAVFDDFRAESEDDARHDKASVYGRNRRDLEVFCAGHFPRCLVVRLPALFGAGLKRNFLFDIMNPMPSMMPRPRFEELAAKLPTAPPPTR